MIRLTKTEIQLLLPMVTTHLCNPTGRALRHHFNSNRVFWRRYRVVRFYMKMSDLVNRGVVYANPVTQHTKSGATEQLVYSLTLNAENYLKSIEFAKNASDKQ